MEIQKFNLLFADLEQTDESYPIRWYDTAGGLGRHHFWIWELEFKTSEQPFTKYTILN